MFRIRLSEAAALAALLALYAGSASAQHTHDMPMPMPMPASPPAVAHDHQAMHDDVMAHMNAHMQMTALRPATAADSVRAQAITDALRAAIAKYRDVKVAEEDGYALFAPNIKTQRVFHFTKKWNAVRNIGGFDAARPTSLLYKKNEAGDFVLVGAMYTASKRTTEDELNARIPLSIAQWHQHINICVPKLRDRERWAEKRDGKMVFGPNGVIATEAECDTAGGRFLPKIFGWMVHANVYAGNDLASVWKDDHRMEPGEMQKSDSDAPAQMGGHNH
jgi:hypothetical protein